MSLFGGLICEPNTNTPGMLFDRHSNYSIEIHQCNPKLERSSFAADGYYLNNFNDPCASFVTLFELTVVNQWHVITEGFVLLTSRWARLYFISFHILMVFIILNIFLAFVIEAFVLQLELETLEFEDVLMDKLEKELERSPALKDEYERTAIKKKRKMCSLTRSFLNLEVLRAYWVVTTRYVLLASLFGEEEDQAALEVPLPSSGPGALPLTRRNSQDLPDRLTRTPGKKAFDDQKAIADASTA